MIHSRDDEQAKEILSGLSPSQEFLRVFVIVDSAPNTRGRVIPSRIHEQFPLSTPKSTQIRIERLCQLCDTETLVVAVKIKVLCCPRRTRVRLKKVVAKPFRKVRILSYWITCRANPS